MCMCSKFSCWHIFCSEQEEMNELPPSRPLTPSEQLDIMRYIEEEELQVAGEPSDRDKEVGTLPRLSLYFYIIT